MRQRLAVSIEHLSKIGGSSLADPASVTEADLGRSEIPSSYIPFRNAHFLSIATSWGSGPGRRIYIGAVAEDSSGYPDCRPEFYAAFQQAIDKGTKPQTLIEIRTRLLRSGKVK